MNILSPANPASPFNPLNPANPASPLHVSINSGNYGYSGPISPETMFIVVGALVLWLAFLGFVVFKLRENWRGGGDDVDTFVFWIAVFLFAFTMAGVVYFL